jgi:hypothetical protein
MPGVLQYVLGCIGRTNIASRLSIASVHAVIECGFWLLCSLLHHDHLASKSGNFT